MLTRSSGIRTYGNRLVLPCRLSSRTDGNTLSRSCFNLFINRIITTNSDRSLSRCLCIFTDSNRFKNCRIRVRPKSNRIYTRSLRIRTESKRIISLCLCALTKCQCLCSCRSSTFTDGNGFYACGFRICTESKRIITRCLRASTNGGTAIP